MGFKLAAWLIIAGLFVLRCHSSSIWNKIDYKVGPWQDFEYIDDEFEEFAEDKDYQSEHDEDEYARNIAEEDDDTIATVTAKIWYVSDFDGQVPQSVIETWHENNALNRVTATVNANLDYLNLALANSDLPIRYVVWGDIQDIGRTDEEIGRQNKSVVFGNLLNRFGDTPEGRVRVYQSADIVLLYLNNPLSEHNSKIYGVCKREVHDPEGNQYEHAILTVGFYEDGWVFAHEAGHCLGGMHLRSEGYSGTRTNFAFCPPGANYGTLDSYPWNCEPGPNGETRGKVPYFSNPDIIYEGVPTGDDQNNNAERIREMRFEYRDAGTNCLDGKPDEKWMNFDSDGTIGNNCPNGEQSYEIPVSETQVDCEYSDWNEWQECDKQCGGGTQSRTREVAREAWYGGIKCTDEDAIESQECNKQLCSVDGGWGEWIAWGECSKPCGNGAQLRTRTCNNPTPAGSGKPCEGDSSEGKECNTELCAIHCEWDEWQISECSKTCGDGTLTKIREEKISAAYGGNECEGENSITESCNVQECIVETGTFTEKKNRYCYEGRYPEKGYDNLDEAKTICGDDDACGKVYDRNCDGDGPFYLCPKDSVLYGSQSSCVYEKDQEDTLPDYDEISHAYCWDQNFVQQTSGSDGFTTLKEAETACNLNDECEMVYACQSGNCGYFLCSHGSTEYHSTLSSLYRKKNK